MMNFFFTLPTLALGLLLWNQDWQRNLPLVGNGADHNLRRNFLHVARYDL